MSLREAQLLLLALDAYKTQKARKLEIWMDLARFLYKSIDPVMTKILGFPVMTGKDPKMDRCQERQIEIPRARTWHLRRFSAETSGCVTSRRHDGTMI